MPKINPNIDWSHQSLDLNVQVETIKGFGNNQQINNFIFLDGTGISEIIANSNNTSEQRGSGINKLSIQEKMMLEGRKPMQVSNFNNPNNPYGILHMSLGNQGNDLNKSFEEKKGMAPINENDNYEDDKGSANSD
jgi:hypothetical protein